MSKAQTCPVCMGKGEVYNPEYLNKTYVKKKKVCNGCGGKGWVTVQD